MAGALSRPTQKAHSLCRNDLRRWGTASRETAHAHAADLGHEDSAWARAPPLEHRAAAAADDGGGRRKGFAGLGGEAATAATNPPVTFRLTGPQNQAINAPNNGGTWDLTGASWNENAPDPIAYPIRSDALTKGAIVGGEVFGNVPKAWTRDQWYNGLNGGRELHGDAYRQTMTNTVDNTLTIQDGYVEDYEDAYDPNAARSDSTTTLEHVRTT